MSRKYNSGESIIEILIVVFFLVTSLVAFVSLTMMSVARNRLSKERIVATRLAQEGVEWARAHRDSIGFDSMYSKIDDGEYCLPDSTQTLETQSETCQVETNNLYNRSITFEKEDGDPVGVPAGDFIEITSTVSWGDKTISQTGILKKEWTAP